MTLQKWLAIIEPRFPPTTPDQRESVRKRTRAYARLKRARERAEREREREGEREREHDEAHCMGCME